MSEQLFLYELEKNQEAMLKKERYEKVIDWFQTNMPVAETELNYSNPYELLVAVILSAQCTDKRVNQMTPDLFKRFPDPWKLAEVEPAEVFDYIRSCSYPQNKSKHLVGMAKILTQEFQGEVPDNLTDLQKMPGVGRKTANVIVSVIYNKPGMAVDTHVFRVAARIGLSTRAKTPLETEKQLIRYIPDEIQPLAHHWLILHGRYVCLARRPHCEKCGLTQWCKHFAQEEKKRLKFDR